MKSAYLCNVYRGIIGTFSRFISILAIVALGVGFFAGLKITTPVMKKTADRYFDEQNLMDICMISTAGFTEEDAVLLEKEPNILKVYPAYSVDAIIDSSSGLKLARIHSIPVKPDNMQMNHPVLVEGRLPQKSGECLLDKAYAESSGGSVGSVITVSSLNEKSTLNMIKSQKFTVTGIVESPSYISIDRGKTALGNGDISFFMFIPDTDFKSDYYTELYASVKGAEKLLCYSDEYTDLIDETVRSLGKFAEKRIQIRYNEILKEAEEQLDVLRTILSPEELQKASDKLKDIKPPEWFIFDRDINPGYTAYRSDTDRVSALTKVFPIFFLLVAGLVSLTTMTRMVEEERTQIGILKALGYSKVSIALKYIIYSGTASLIGSVTGLLLGYWIFPSTIYNAYCILYTLPEVVLFFDMKYALITSFAAIICTTLVAIFACYHELASVPAELMRPKAPKPGRRVLLERIKQIWTRLNFTQKVSLRNLFRYKKKFFMTVIGISGCTALLLTGFGLRDAIGGIVPKQFDDIHNYDIIINLSYFSSSMEKTSLNQYLSESPGNHLYIAQSSVDVDSENGRISAYLFVPENADKLNTIILFKNRVDNKKIKFPQPGKAIITEKLAEKLSVNVGDKITFKVGNTKELTADIGAICENYINNYIYLSDEDYKNLLGTAPLFNQVLYQHPDNNKSDYDEDSMLADILADENVSAIFSTTKIRSGFEDMIKNLNAVVALIIICACLLAFIVLYNLTNINIAERIREIATIKVLGFYDNEVSIYIYRENIILTIIGMLIGLAVGVYLHKYVVKTAEVDLVMFDRSIKVLSYIMSAVFTMVFAAMVNFIIHFKLKKINMVESLKSVE